MTRRERKHEMEGRIRVRGRSDKPVNKIGNVGQDDTLIIIINTLQIIKLLRTCEAHTERILF